MMKHIEDIRDTFLSLILAAALGAAGLAGAPAGAWAAQSFPADASKANLDQSTDDPKQARVDLADLVDKFNALKAALEPIAAMTVGSGLTVTDNGAGVADTLSVTAVESFVTGDGILTLNPTAPAGWVMANDGTIGSASSGATARANADTEPLFTLIWNQIADAYAPVSGGRGASAAADFAANKTIKLGRNVGRALAVAGAGAGLTARALGEFLGEEEHTLSEAEMPVHDHAAGTLAGPLHTHPGVVKNSGTTGVNLDGAGIFRLETGSTASNTVGNPVTGSTATSGSGDAHNVMQPTSFWHVKIKL